MNLQSFSLSAVSLLTLLSPLTASAAPKTTPRIQPNSIISAGETTRGVSAQYIASRDGQGASIQPITLDVPAGGALKFFVKSTRSTARESRYAMRTKMYIDDVTPPAPPALQMIEQFTREVSWTRESIFTFATGDTPENKLLDVVLFTGRTERRGIVRDDYAIIRLNLHVIPRPVPIERPVVVAPRGSLIVLLAPDLPRVPLMFMDEKTPAAKIDLLAAPGEGVTVDSIVAYIVHPRQRALVGDPLPNTLPLFQSATLETDSGQQLGAVTPMPDREDLSRLRLEFSNLSFQIPKDSKRSVILSLTTKKESMDGSQFSIMLNPETSVSGDTDTTHMVLSASSIVFYPEPCETAALTVVPTVPYVSWSPDFTGGRARPSHAQVIAKVDVENPANASNATLTVDGMQMAVSRINFSPHFYLPSRKFFLYLDDLSGSPIASITITENVTTLLNFSYRLSIPPGARKQLIVVNDTTDALPGGALTVRVTMGARRWQASQNGPVYTINPIPSSAKTFFY